MVSQVLRDVLVPAFSYTCGSGGAYGGHGSESRRIIQQTVKKWQSVGELQLPQQLSDVASK